MNLFENVACLVVYSNKHKIKFAFDLFYVQILKHYYDWSFKIESRLDGDTIAIGARNTFACYFIYYFF